MGVVGALEVVKVDEQDREWLAAAARARERLFEELVRRRSVVQPGERVVGGLVGEALLEALALHDRAREHEHGLAQRLAETARQRFGEDGVLEGAFGQRAGLLFHQAQVADEVVKRLRDDGRLLRAARGQARKLEISAADRARDLPSAATDA